MTQLTEGLTAAPRPPKKILIMMWIPSCTLSVKLRLSSYHGVLILEMSVASVNNAEV